MSEVALVQHEQIDVGVTYNGRGARTVIEKGELTDHGPGAQARQPATVPVNAHDPVENDEGLTTRLPLLDQRPTSLEGDLVAGSDDLSQLLGSAVNEKGYVVQCRQWVYGAFSHTASVRLSV